MLNRIKKECCEKLRNKYFMDDNQVLREGKGDEYNPSLNKENHNHLFVEYSKKDYLDNHSIELLIYSIILVRSS